MKTNLKFLISVILLMVLLSFNVFGFAITSYYWDKRPLYLEPGESREIQAFGLQNMVGNKDTIIKVSQDSGFEIAKIIDDSLEYEVPFGRKDIYVNMMITIPPDTEPGTYRIGASFKEIATEKEEGTVQFVMGMTNNIVIIVKGEEIEIETPEEIIAPIEEQPSESISDSIFKRKAEFGTLLLILGLIAIILFYRREYTKKK